MTIAQLTARFLANSHLSWFVWDERDIQNQWSPGPKIIHEEGDISWTREIDSTYVCDKCQKAPPPKLLIGAAFASPTSNTYLPNSYE